MRLTAILLAMFATSCVTSAFAQVRPVPGIGDPRLQTVQYDPNQIVQLSVVPGLQLMVSVAPGERIETIAVGDSVSWQVTASKRGDVFFVKNIRASAMTNLTIVTDARTYAFELMPSSGYGGDTAFTVKFIYGAAPPATAQQDENERIQYRVRGARRIRPDRVYQLGNQTVIEWHPDQLMPAVFEKRQKQEILVNGEMQDDRFVLVGTPHKLVFRLDRQIATAVRSTKGGKTREAEK